MSRIVNLVTLAGLLPFIAGLVFAIFPDMAPIESVMIERALIGFGAVILSFLGGVRWGLRLQGGAGSDLTFVMGMLGAIGGLVMLLLPYEAALTLLAIGFGLQGIWDMRSSGVPTAYASMRGLMTWVVCAIIIAILILRLI
jgi:hypothetical protein